MDQAAFDKTARHRFATAADVMTREVISVDIASTVRDAASLMLAKRVSAVPVLDGGRHLAGMVSEGDLLGREEVDRQARQDWWLALVKGGDLTPRPFSALAAQSVKDVMHMPVVTVEPGTALHIVAELLRVHDIKRLPVVEDGFVVGIVSRGDLLQVIEGLPTPKSAAAHGQGLLAMIMSMAGQVPEPPVAPEAGGAVQAPAVPVSAKSFRELMAMFDEGKLDAKRGAQQAARLAHTRQVKAMLQENVSEDMWSALLAHAHTAAVHGQKVFELLRFPSDLCSDGGRKINVGEADWPTTLRGEAADMYGRWEHDLKSAGFGVVAEVVSYPGGKPGDVALSLSW